VLSLNPMNEFVKVYRSLLYDAGPPSLTAMLVLVLSAAVSVTLGWLVFRRFSRRLPEEV
jgi:ABC-2 type transport system permease protein